MGGLAAFWQEGDALIRTVALLLLAMSVASWFVILWKSAMLAAAARRVPRAIAAFWAAPHRQDAPAAALAADPQGLTVRLADVAAKLDNQAANPADRADDASAPNWQSRPDRVRRELRSALNAASRQLHAGHVLLASVGSTAPFVGLFGTVWGIYHALTTIAATQQVSIDKVAGPVGETLIMTAAGLAVAIPAVLAYNALGKRARALDAELEGYALDLQHLLSGEAAPRHANGSA
ncbi:Biopolymer transport protein ExbB [Thiomonas sp. X19]|uniref:MotA/TolQ/ExbB proton channel family protein n=1 Tax=Thiomonas sp. X19 TaxID=1050370 RepID=UPI000B7117D5|nr:MotA/TolQ/ExbB proton channel family protein [Thiomonas sp. X19]SCC91491.1 Biopolymer transport protein ExbB [Thiomonas sp. X19]